jgi:Protein of unknown function (DUF3298)
VKLIAAVVLSAMALFPATAGAQTSCDELGGAVEPAGTCHVHGEGPDYRMDLAFPTDYVDEPTLAGYVTQQRDEFLDWVAKFGGASFAELDMGFDDYQSTNTRSAVLTIGRDTGVHPFSTFTTFTYDVTKRAPVTIDTLFKPGSQPLAVLNPIVAPEFEKHGAKLRADELTLNDYRSFALTDDTVLFFFDQDWPMDHVSGPLTVTVPRAALPSILA